MSRPDHQIRARKEVTVALEWTGNDPDQANGQHLMEEVGIRDASPKHGFECLCGESFGSMHEAAEHIATIKS